MQGELHFPDDPRPAREPRAPWSVSRLNREVRTCLEAGLGAVWVTGEISNLRRQASGHVYFSLKDEASQVSCVMFRSAAASAPALQDGRQVEVSGELGVYEPRGQYQIVVRRVQARGAGGLEAKLRALQERLRAEGLFDPSRKRALPPHPARVGVVTSPTGAAIRDFLHILQRRAPHIEVFIAPVRVQGAGASREIAAAVEDFAAPERSGFPAVDVIVVTRGGGSLEDLWEFNEEVVARAIAASPVPVISAVGHETDVTTSDHAADVRAPTPSAAAELLSADREETLRQLASARHRLAREAAGRLELARAQFDRLASSGVFLLPARRIADLQQQMDDLLDRAGAAVRARFAVGRESSRRAWSVLRAHHPAAKLSALRERLAALDQRRGLAVSASLLRRREQSSRRAHALELLGPRQTLARGFTLTLDADRRPVREAAQAAAQERLTTVFADGEVVSRPEPS
jgi:exodeoxyribonuclease VII large subunit